MMKVPIVQTIAIRPALPGSKPSASKPRNRRNVDQILDSNIDRRMSPSIASKITTKIIIGMKKGEPEVIVIDPLIGI